MSGSRWTEARAATWRHASPQIGLADHQVYYLKCLGTGSGESRWLDGRTSDGAVGLAQITTWPYTGTRWRAHKLPDGSWGLRCLGDRPGNRWLDGRTTDGTIGLAPSPRYPYTGARWQVLPVTGGIALKCLGEVEGQHKRFLDGVTANGSTSLAPNINSPYTGTHWEVRPEVWRVGCNFIPSTAANQLEMWQRESFDLATIRRELGWAQDLGFNAVRVFLHDLLWSDSSGFVERLRAYLDAAAEHKIGTLFVFFDDCWNSSPKAGPQPAPLSDAHNSQWVQSPGDSVVASLADHAVAMRLEAYVKGVLEALGDDGRVIGWDLYNEPGGGLGSESPPCRRQHASLPLLKLAFAWARDVDPSQPLTSGVWDINCGELRDYQLQQSDIITFHRYADPGAAVSVPTEIASLQTLKRPVVCTEYMARPLNSRFENHLAVFNETGVGCFNWGLVAGKTQTFLPWGWEPRCEWFHDIYHAWGTPYSASEVAIVRCLTGKTPSGAGIQHNAVYQFRCLGHLPGNPWLNGRTVERTVDLAPNTQPPYSGTRWRAVKQMEGVFAFYCLGDVDTPNRWLDGNTQDATVSLAPDTDQAHTGTHWQLCHVRDTVYICRCLGDIEGRRLLDGRTAESKVALTPRTGTAITGIQWELTKVSDA